MFILVHDELIIKLLQNLSEEGNHLHHIALNNFFYFRFKFNLNFQWRWCKCIFWNIFNIWVRREQKLTIDIEFQAKHVLCVRTDKLLVRFHWFYTRIISSHFFLTHLSQLGQDLMTLWPSYICPRSMMATNSSLESNSFILKLWYWRKIWTRLFADS